VIIQKIAAFISDHNLISANDHIIVALSGGRDSVFLLHVLLELQKTLKIDLSAVHINHGTRGEESTRDEIFAVDLCSKKNIKCSVYKLHGFSSESGENALRRARYAQFEHHLQKNENAKIATAHHLDDQLETYLMRLFKGSGLKGLRGIPPGRAKYIRPLLSCSRRDIDHYCHENKIKYVDDSTNAVHDRLRNKIRHQILPDLSNVFGNDFLQQFEEGRNKQTQFYNDALKLYHLQFENLITIHKDRLELSTSHFDSFNNIQKQLFIEYCFYVLNGVSFLLTKDQLKQFEIFNASAQSGSFFILHDSLHALKDRSRLFFYVSEPELNFTKELYQEQSVIVGDYFISVKSWSGEDIEFDTNKNVEFINGDKIRFPLVVRSWRKGDYFYPLGKKGKQKVSDFFINEKVDRKRKLKIPIIENNHEIVWICGERLDNRYKITKQDQLVYKLEFNNNVIKTK